MFDPINGVEVERIVKHVMQFVFRFQVIKKPIAFSCTGCFVAAFGKIFNTVSQTLFIQPLSANEIQMYPVHTACRPSNHPTECIFMQNLRSTLLLALTGTWNGIIQLVQNKPFLRLVAEGMCLHVAEQETKSYLCSQSDKLSSPSHFQPLDVLFLFFMALPVL
jgi:hypothetical protein